MNSRPSRSTPCIRRELNRSSSSTTAPSPSSIQRSTDTMERCSAMDKLEPVSEGATGPTALSWPYPLACSPHLMSVRVSCFVPGYDVVLSRRQDVHDGKTL